MGFKFPLHTRLSIVGAREMKCQLQQSKRMTTEYTIGEQQWSFWEIKPLFLAGVSILESYLWATLISV
jgi:hypothetical protein